MKIRFTKNDAVDTKELSGVVGSPIYTAELTEEEVGYIKLFVETCSGFISSGGNHIEMSIDVPGSEDKCLIVKEVVDTD